MIAANVSVPADAIKTAGLSKSYDGTAALRQVDMTVPNGAVYALVGANGAGKSTLFRILMNLENPDIGTVKVFGLDSVSSGPDVRAQTGYVQERHSGYPWMTCGRLLQHVAEYFPAWDAGYASHLVSSLGVRLDRKTGTLSKGDTRRLQLVIALAHRPPLLLLDEPTDGLDPVIRDRALTLLAEHLADSPTTILVATHHLSEIETLADHVGVLRDGRLIAQASRDELRRTTRRYNLDVPDGWELPPDVQTFGLRRSRSGTGLQCTISGEENMVVAQLIFAGAQVQDSVPLELDDAVVALLSGEDGQ